jgi:hypothetical protein
MHLLVFFLTVKLKISHYWLRSGQHNAAVAAADNCKSVATRWQWSFYILHMYGLRRLITLDLVSGVLHGKHVVATWKGK